MYIERALVNRLKADAESLSQQLPMREVGFSPFQWVGECLHGCNVVHESSSCSCNVITTTISNGSSPVVFIYRCSYRSKIIENAKFALSAEPGEED